MSRYAFHPDAVNDLNDVWDYLADRNVPAANRVVDEILEKTAALAASPLIGHRRPELTSAPLRFFVVREYLIAYLPGESQITIVAVIHGRRNPRIMATILQGRSLAPDPAPPR